MPAIKKKNNNQKHLTLVMVYTIKNVLYLCNKFSLVKILLVSFPWMICTWGPGVMEFCTIDFNSLLIDKYILN